MRFRQGRQSRCPPWVVVGLLVGTFGVLPGAAVSVAQEIAGPLVERSAPESAGTLGNAIKGYPSPSEAELAEFGYFRESFPAEQALAKLQADGHSPSESGQLLLAQMPQGEDWPDAAQDPELASSVQLLDNRLFVLGSREYIHSVEAQLFRIQEFGLPRLSYTVRIIEIPTKEAEHLIAEWDLVGLASSQITPGTDSDLQRNSAVVPASFTDSHSSFSTLVSGVLSDGQVQQLVDAGTVLSAPRIVAHNGQAVNLQTGTDVPFVTSFEPAKDKNGNDTSTMQPKVVCLHDGMSLDLTGVLDAEKENVRLNIKYEQSEIKGVDTFTFESTQGPLTVQQPRFSSRGIQTAVNAPIDKTMAIYGGPTAREVYSEQGVPLLKRIPYVGRFFKNTAKATESVSTIILIRLASPVG